MNVETTSLCIIILPIVASIIVPILARMVSTPKVRDWYAVAIAAVTHALTWGLVPQALNGDTTIVELKLWSPLDAVFVIDPLAIFMAVTASFLSLVIILYSTNYMAGKKHLTEYYMMVLLFVGAMMGLVFSAHLIYLFLFWEISSLCSWRLISFYRQEEHITKGNKAFLVTFAGAGLMLVGFIWIYVSYGTFDLTQLRGITVSGGLVALILFGMLSKSATVPFHTWLPDAGVAPSTVTSLLHAAVLVKIGVYAFARIFNWAIDLQLEWQQVIMWIGLASAMISACAALVETNIKRILAYSTISQLGYIFMGLASFNTMGVAGALLYILMHGIAKAGLFLIAGIIEHGTGTKDITRMGGLIKFMPATAIAFLLNALSIIGIPPFGGFFSKFMVIQGVIASNNYIIGALAIFTAVLTMVYLLRPFRMIFFGQQRDEMLKPHHEGTKLMVAVVVGLATLSLLAGLLIQYPMDAICHAVRDMLTNPGMVDIYLP